MLEGSHYVLQSCIRHIGEDGKPQQHTIYCTTYIVDGARKADKTRQHSIGRTCTYTQIDIHVHVVLAAKPKTVLHVHFINASVLTITIILHKGNLMVLT